MLHERLKTFPDPLNQNSSINNNYDIFASLYLTRIIFSIEWEHKALPIFKE